MHAFDYITVLLSFVYALAIAHLLATVGDLLKAGHRVRYSWLHGGWMVIALAPVIAWWIGLCDLRALPAWNMALVGTLFVLACGMYILTRLVSPPIPAEGEIDLRAFHRDHGRAYMGVFAGLAVATVVFNIVLGGVATAWSTQNQAVAPMVLAAVIGAALSSNGRVQAVVLVAELGLWIWYYASMQAPLSGSRLPLQPRLTLVRLVEQRLAGAVAAQVLEEQRIAPGRRGVAGVGTVGGHPHLGVIPKPGVRR